MMLIRDKRFVILTDRMKEDLVKQVCSDPNRIIEITRLSDKKMRELPEHIDARIMFEGEKLTLYAKSFRSLSAIYALKICFPNVESLEEIFAENASIHAPQLKKVDTRLFAQDLNDVSQCGNISSLILTARNVTLSGVKSIGQAHFTRAAAIILRDTEAINTELVAPEATHMAFPALETLDGYLYARKLETIGFSAAFLSSAKLGNRLSPSVKVETLDAPPTLG